MEITFQLTAADVESLLRARHFQVRWWWSWLVLLGLMCSYFLAATLLLIALQLWYGLISGLMLLCLLLLHGMWQTISVRGRAREMLRASLDKGLTTVRLRPEQLEIHSPVAQSRRAWSEVTRMDCTSDFVIFHLRRNLAFGIPRRSFRSPADAEQFAASAQRYADESRAADRYVSAAIWNPENDDFIRVRFPLPPENYVMYNVAASKPGAKPARQSSTWFGCVLLLTGGVICAVAAQRAPWLMQMLAGLMIYFGIGVPSLVIQQKIAQLWKSARARRDTEPDLIVTVSAAGVHALRSQAELLRRWTLIDEVAMDHQFLVFYEVKPIVGQLIPRNSFATADDALQFFERAKNYWERAHDVPHALEPAEDLSNPYRSPSQ